MAKHAYLIMAHDNINVIKHALSMIDDVRNTVFLLIDQKSRDFDVNDLQNCIEKSTLILEPRIMINWAGYSMIEAMLLLITSAVEYNRNFSYYHFLQGADLPIKPQAYIHDYFDEHQGKEFIDFNPQVYEFSIYKKSYYHFFVDNRYFRDYMIIKLLNHLLAKLQRSLGIKRKSAGKIYQGSALFSITDELARYVLGHKENIRSEYKHTLACDEVFLQTLTMRSNFKNTLYAYEKQYLGNSRLIDITRSRQKNSPHTFTIEDLKMIMNAGEEICFARKFHESVDMKIVEALHYKIKGFFLE